MKFADQTTLHHKFLENMHDAVLILDSNYNVLDTNHIASLWYGYTDDEFKKLNLRDLRAAGERDKVSKQMQGVAKHEGGIWETIHQRKDGSTFAVEVSSTPIVVGDQKRFYHVVRDISVRKKHEDVLRASEERYKQIVELSPDAIFLHRDGKIIYMNMAGMKLFGFANPDEVIGQSLWMLYPPERHGIVRARNQLMEQTQQMAPLIEHTMLRADGSPITVEAIARIINYQDQPAFYVLLRDISERKKNKLLVDLQFAVSQQFINSEYLLDAITNTLKTICTALKLDSARIWTLDSKEQNLRCMTTWSNDANAQLGNKTKMQTVLGMGEGMTGKIFQNAKPAWIELSKAKYKLCIGVPIHVGKETIGVMELFALHARAEDHELMQALTAIGYQIGAYIKRKTHEKELRYMSKHDAVTGLSNRFLFEENLSYEINRAKNNDQRLALVYFDINSFSSINGTLGYAAGDQLLKSVADRILQMDVRADLMSRFGDDQFALILPNIGSMVEVIEFINNIKQNLSESFSIDNQNINVSVSIGASLYPEDGEDVATLMKNAIIAVKAAKKQGKGAFQFSNADMSMQVKKQISMENDLRHAIDKQEFLLFYQPIVDSNTMNVVGLEALLRWKHNGVLVSPGDFIPVLESSGLMLQVGDWLIKTACQQGKIWQDLYKTPLFMSVNISQVQFANTNIVNTIKSTLQSLNFPAEQLKIEMTESIIMDHIERGMQTLSAIQELGVKVSIDDFGTGYSSLNYLRRLPIDYLKIDQSFVREMMTNSNDAAIVKTIIELGDNLGYGLIAEGVETKQQLEFLHNLGCHYIQGYYFSRPMPVDEATVFLKQGKLLA